MAHFFNKTTIYYGGVARCFESKVTKLLKFTTAKKKANIFTRFLSSNLMQDKSLFVKKSRPTWDSSWSRVIAFFPFCQNKMK